VITVYAGAAFVILELVDIIAEPLKLPSWLLPVVIVLLSIGFIIAVILSWIYDINPEGGMVKTEAADKVKVEDSPKSSNSWKIASYISFVVIVGLIVLNIIPRAGNKEILDNTIAVLPFINDSQNDSTTYFINGIMDEILINLQAIKGFRVQGRTSVEQYRNQSKAVPEIANELGVNYIVEGSGQKNGNTLVLRVQLLEGATGMHIWAKSFEQEIESVEVITSIQSGIAKSIASELQAIITPEEKQLIEKIPTTSLTAYEFYLQGEDELWNYSNINLDQAALIRAKEMFNKALEYDSTFARAFVGLGEVYWQNHMFDAMLSENYMDSVLYYANKALSYDNQLASAYTLKGRCLMQLQLPEKALEEYDKAVALNPNYSEVYLAKGWLYQLSLYDNVLSLLNFHKAAELTHGKELPTILRQIGYNYIAVGFNDRGMQYTKQALELDGDSAMYFNALSTIKWANRDFEGVRDLRVKICKLDSNIWNILALGEIYLLLGEYKESMRYWQMLRDENEEAFTLIGLDMIGYTYWKLGNLEKANYFLDKAIEIGSAAIETGGIWEFVAFWQLAGVYAVRGERNKALEYLKRSSVMMVSKERIVSITSDPRFESLRDEPEFQQIVLDMEAKYQAEHERVRQWLEENDML